MRMIQRQSGLDYCRGRLCKGWRRERSIALANGNDEHVPEFDDFQMRIKIQLEKRVSPQQDDSDVCFAKRADTAVNVFVPLFE